MVKKVLALALGLVLAVSTMAQWGSGNPTVPQSDIQFWTGTGSNRAVIAVTWEDDNEDLIGIAWGVQWNGGSIMLKSLMDTIAAYDSRFNVTYSSPSWLDNITYNDTNLGLNLVGTAGWWWYNWKDSADVDYQSSGVAADMIQNGDFVDWMQMGVADTMIMATDPNPAPVDPEYEDATIAFSDILYWVGEGTNQVVLAVNWADTALAWGYRFATDSVSVQTVMEDIAAADPRFSFSGDGWLNDINFVEVAGDTLGAVTPGWWMSTLNGNSNASAGMTTMLANNDFFKWGDYTIGITIDTVTYAMVFTATVYPVSAPAEEAPVDATIDFSDILYWVGEGTNQVVLAVNWADTALAWGYKFSTDSVSVQTVMEDIAAADPRFSFSGDGWLNDINFVEVAGDTLGAVTPGWWMSTLNGNSNASAGMTTMLVNNDLFKWGDYTIGITIDTVTYAMVFTATVYPVSAPAEEAPVDATIDFSDILYWVGEGTNQVVLAVNWADTALAWGYKFSTDSVSVQTVMEDIAAADPRFSFSGDGWLNDINFVEVAGDTLGAVTPGWWMSTLNGNSNASTGMTTMLANNDFFKWGDYTIGITIDTVTYAMVFTTTIHPVSVPQTEGISVVEGMSVSVYPNPAVSTVNVSFDALESASEVELFDMTGRRVAVYPVAAGCSDIQLSVDGLANGIYMLRMADATAKVIVRK